VPFYVVMISATRSTPQINQGFSLIPSNNFFVNMNSMLSQIKMFRGMLNTLIISVSSTVLGTYFSALTANGFEFYEFKGKKVLFSIIIATLMVPASLGLIGFYRICLTYHILDTYVPMIVPAIASSFSVFFLRQYMKGNVHRAIVDAARIDGASEMSIFHRIIIPITSPAVVTIALMTFIGTWNDYIRARLLIFSLDKQTLAVMVGSLKARIDGGDIGARYAGIAVSIIPIIILFVIASKYIISNVSAGSVKG